MSDGAFGSMVLASIGMLIATYPIAMYPEERTPARRRAVVIGGIFCLPALVRLWIVAVAG